MVGIMKRGSSDGRLCGELAAALARRVTILDERQGSKGAAFYHDSTSAFEATTAVLTKFGLLEPVADDERPGETWYCLHALTMDADDMPNSLARTVPDGDDRLFDLLVAFLKVFCQYDSLSDRRTLFSPPRFLLPAMRHLARLGYAATTADQFRWTELVEPAMQAALVWDENSVGFADARRQKVEAEAKLAWRTMPETIRSGYFSTRPLNRLVIVTLVRQCWNGEVWTSPEEISDVTNQFELAYLLIRIANGNRI
jgi:hypothetical protein